jgi:hypothetical protein
VKLGRTFLILATAGTVALSGCTGTATTGSDTASAVNVNVDVTVDITDAILTNLSGDCADYSASYQADVTDVQRDLPFTAQFAVTEDATSCAVTANDIPNYDFNDGTGRFADPVATQNISLSIPRNPEAAATTTELSLLTYNAIMLNGVVLDQVANGCYKPDDASADENGNVANGCGLWVDWRLDPMGTVQFGTDSHNAHTQPGGLYHYHGNPMALFDPQETDQGSPVIGFAADGFPIYGPHYIDATTGAMLEATSGYTLKVGDRPTSESSPGGSYDGTYIQDYEFTDSGTLDECNGMTVDGQYGYYVTSSYPYVMGCYTGTPSLSFFKLWDIAWWIMGGILGLLLVLSATIVFVVRRRRQKKEKK